MSSTHVAPKGEHGTLGAYVTGFLLSLVFTFIPYYMVVNQTVSGNALLATILAFGVLQMIVQVTFFLHLGRGPKPNWNLFFFISTVGIILVVVGGSIMIIDNLKYNMSPSDQKKKLVSHEGIHEIDGVKTGACKGQYPTHKVTIKDGQVTPLHTVAKRCDTLMFINEDETPREITFGTHPNHGAYAGEDELLLKKGRNKSITLSESGTYQFHDHFDEKTAGDFFVAP